MDSIKDLIPPELLAAAQFEAECGQPPARFVMKTSLFEDRLAKADKTLEILDRYFAKALKAQRSQTR